MPVTGFGQANRTSGSLGSTLRCPSRHWPERQHRQRKRPVTSGRLRFTRAKNSGAGQRSFVSGREGVFGLAVGPPLAQSAIPISSIGRVVCDAEMRAPSHQDRGTLTRCDEVARLLIACSAPGGADVPGCVTGLRQTLSIAPARPTLAMRFRSPVSLGPRPLGVGPACEGNKTSV